MNSVHGLSINENASLAFEQKRYSLTTVLLMLFCRTVLFFIFQSILFILFLILKTSSPWDQSAAWWPFSVTFTNIICVFLLGRLLRKEGKRFKDFFLFEKGTIIKNFLMMSILLLLCMPFAYLPNLALGNLLFGNYTTAITLFYRPLPLIAAVIASLSFPLTMPLGELTVYFGYVMPRLEVITKKKWISTVLPVLMLSFQHAALPLLFDTRFIVWRLFMFLPFAILIALVIRWKPKLFPYILVGHFFIDLMNAITILTISMNVS